MNLDGLLVRIDRIMEALESIAESLAVIRKLEEKKRHGRTWGA